MRTKKKFAIILSGCGFYDGSEIHEATLIMLAVDRTGSEYQVFAPDINQVHVVNHLTGEVMNETRNVLVESARIARGKISDLSAYRASDYDALLLPGGFGAAKNLSSFAFEADYSVIPGVEKAVKETVKAGKPVGAVCIAPVILAKLLPGVKVTIGTDEGTAAKITARGAVHKQTVNGEVVVDEKHKVATAPCYMFDAAIGEVAKDAELVVQAIYRML